MPKPYAIEPATAGSGERSGGTNRTQCINWWQSAWLCSGLSAYWFCVQAFWLDMSARFSWRNERDHCSLSAIFPVWATF